MKVLNDLYEGTKRIATYTANTIYQHPYLTSAFLLLIMANRAYAEISGDCECTGSFDQLQGVNDFYDTNNFAGHQWDSYPHDPQSSIYGHVTNTVEMITHFVVKDLRECATPETVERLCQNACAAIVDNAKSIGLLPFRTIASAELSGSCDGGEVTTDFKYS